MPVTRIVTNPEPAQVDPLLIITVAETGSSYGSEDEKPDCLSEAMEASEKLHLTVAVESGATHIGIRRMRSGLYVHLDHPESELALTRLAFEAQKPDVVYKGVVYRVISEANARTYIDWGVPVKSGFLQVANSNEVRHIIKQHGDAVYENLRGQMPITPGDFAKLPEVAKPENIIAATLLQDGRFSIFYQKRVNGHVLMTELIGGKNGQMSLKTLMKKETEWGTPAVLSSHKAGQVINVRGDRDATPPSGPGDPNVNKL